MNKFDNFFFKSYVSEWSEILWVIHWHFIIVLNKVLSGLLLFAIIPSFLYFESLLLQEKVPFLYFEVYLILTFIKVVYDIFDWYCDVWIITDSGVVDLEWSFLQNNNVSLKFENIEWIEVEQSWLWDKVLWKWMLVIHKVWDWTFTLPDASRPFAAVDEIEEASNMHFDEDDWVEDGQSFNDVMHFLWDVIKDHIDKKEETNDYDTPEYDDLEELKEKIKRKDWTIDLS